MKNYQSKLSVLTLVLLTSLGAQATDVTSTFNPGDTLTATQMTEIKDAVNSKQNRVSGVCPPGEAIGSINADGTVTCEVDTDTTYSAGSGLTLVGTQFSITSPPSQDRVYSYFQFRPWFGGQQACHIRGFGFGSFSYLTTSTTSSCGIFLPINNLPNGATLTQLSCTLFDNFVSGSLSFSVVGRTKSGGNASGGLSTGATVDSASDQIVTSTAGNVVLNNTLNDYFLFSSHSTATTAGTGLLVKSCTLSYLAP